MAFVLRHMGVLMCDQSEYDSAREYLLKSLTIVKKIGDRRSVASCLSWLGISALFQGDIEGERLIRESVAIYNELGERIRILAGTELASIGLLILGYFENVRALLEEVSLAVNRCTVRMIHPN